MGLFTFILVLVGWFVMLVLVSVVKVFILVGWYNYA